MLHFVNRSELSRPRPHALPLAGRLNSTFDAATAEYANVVSKSNQPSVAVEAPKRFAGSVLSASRINLFQKGH